MRAAILVAALVLAARAASWASLEASPLSRWYLWGETDEHGYVAWSARLAAGSWLDVPAWRAYAGWQEAFGSREDWERRYARNVYFAGPLYPYALAVLRRAGIDVVTGARLGQLLLAVAASAAVAAAAARAAERCPVRPGVPTFAGTVAGLLHGLYGPLLFHDGFLYRDGPVAHVTAILVAAPVLLGRERGEGRGRAGPGLLPVVLVGLGGGLAVLLKQTLLPIALAATVAVALGRGEGRRSRGLVLVAAGTVALAVGILPLLLRNAAVGAPLLAFDTRQAICLAWGNAPGADGGTGFPAAAVPILDEAKGSTGRTALLVWKAWEGKRASLAGLFVTKARGSLCGFELPDNSSFDFFRDRFRWLGWLPVWSCLFGPGLAGLLWGVRCGALRRVEAAVVGIALAATFASCLLVGPVSRYRASAAGPLALGAGLLAVLLVSSVRARAPERWSAARSALLALSLSALTLVPSGIPRERHRFSDALVAATLAERFESPAAGAAEVERYLHEGRDDPARNTGVFGMMAWWGGERSHVRVDAEGVAPPALRYRPSGPPAPPRP